MSGDVFWEYLIYVKRVHFDMKAGSEWERKAKGNLTVPQKVPFSFSILSLYSF